MSRLRITAHNNGTRVRTRFRFSPNEPSLRDDAVAVLGVLSGDPPRLHVRDTDRRRAEAFADLVRSRADLGGITVDVGPDRPDDATAWVGFSRSGRATLTAVLDTVPDTVRVLLGLQNIEHSNDPPGSGADATARVELQQTNEGDTHLRVWWLRDVHGTLPGAVENLLNEVVPPVVASDHPDADVVVVQPASDGHVDADTVAASVGELGFPTAVQRRVAHRAWLVVDDNRVDFHLTTDRNVRSAAERCRRAIGLDGARR